MSIFSKSTEGAIAFWARNKIQQPLHHWKLNEESAGPAVDYGVNPVNGTTTGATINQTGYRGKAYSFDGDDYITISPPPDVVQNIKGTVNLWMYWSTDTGAEEYALSIGKSQSGTNHLFYIKADFGASRDDIIAGVTVGGTDQWKISSGADSTDYLPTWMMVTVVHDGVQPRLFINGREWTYTVLVSTDLTAWMKDLDDHASSIDAMYIGKHVRTDFTSPYNGKLQHVMLWDYNLTDNEIAQLYEDRRYIVAASDLPDPLFYCPLDSPLLQDRGSAGSHPLKTDTLFGIDDDRKHYYFDGSSSKIEASEGLRDIEFSTEDIEYTTCCWFKAHSSANAFFVVFESAAGIASSAASLYWDNGTVSGYHGNSITPAQKTGLSQDVWYHVAVVGKINKTIDLYIDGVYQDSGSYTNHVQSASADITIGYDTTPRYGNSSIAEILLFNTALTVDQINAVMNGKYDFELKIDERDQKIKGSVASDVEASFDLPDLYDWQHIGMTWEQQDYPQLTGIRLYLNGQRQTEMLSVDDVQSLFGEAVFGADSLKGRQSGLMYDKIYVGNRQLSDSEMYKLYASQSLK